MLLSLCGFEIIQKIDCYWLQTRKVTKVGNEKKIAERTSRYNRDFSSNIKTTLNNSDALPRIHLAGGTLQLITVIWPLSFKSAIQTERLFLESSLIYFVSVNQRNRK